MTMYEEKMMRVCQNIRASLEKKLDKEEREKQSILYLIARNYLKKEEFRFEDLIRLTGKNEIELYSLLYEAGISRVPNRLWLTLSTVRWNRIFIRDVADFFNYPLYKEKRVNYWRMVNFLHRAKSRADFKNVLVGLVELGKVRAFSQALLNEIKATAEIATSGHCKYIFQQFVSIYEEEFPEIKISNRTEDSDDSTQEKGEETADIEEGPEIDLKELLEQNTSLKNRLDEALANADYLDLQMDNLQSRFKEYSNKVESEAKLNLFKNLNSIENSCLLNAFYQAKRVLDQLRASGWTPDPPTLESSLFFYDLFADFLKKEDVTTKFSTGDILEITLGNINDFEYNGSEMTPETIVKARVKTPAWYLKDKVISKAKIVEIMDQK